MPSLTDEERRRLELTMELQIEAYRQSLAQGRPLTPNSTYQEAAANIARAMIRPSNVPPISYDPDVAFPPEWAVNASPISDDHDVTFPARHQHINTNTTEEVMPAPDNTSIGYLMPSEEILLRNAEKSHLFNQITIDLRNPDSAVSRANAADQLKARNFTSHPFIHTHYYDSIANGLLKVRDVFTNELIRKEEAVLLSNGTFTDYNSPNILRPNTHRTKILELLDNPDRSVENLWIYNAENESYIPFSRSYVRLCVSSIKFMGAARDLFRNSTLDYDRSSAGPLSAGAYESVRRVFLARKFIHLSSIGNIRIITDEVINSENSIMFKIPNNQNTPFAGLIIVGLDNPPRNLDSDDYTLELDITGSITTFNAQLRDTTPIETLLDECVIFESFRIKYRYRRLSESQTFSNTTENNLGRLIQYSHKVEAYKKCFLLTPEEEKRYAGLPAIIEKSKKANAKKIKDLQDEMSKAGLSDTAYRELDQKLRTLRNRKIFGTPEDKPIYMGFELEMQVRAPHDHDIGFRDTVKSIADTPGLGDHVILKADASTGRYGLEMVSVPASLNYHKKVMSETFFKPDGLVRNFKAGNNCGIHVHISKESFTKLSLAKFITFINSSQNKYFIDKIAGRPENGYCRKMALRKYRDGKEFIHGYNAKRLDLFNENTWSQRGATNLATTSKTVEVRIFKSTTQKRNFMRKLEFCEALVRFCRPNYSSSDEMDVHSFVDFLLIPHIQKDYPHLLRWLDHKGFAPREKRQGVKKLSYVYSKNNIIPTEYKLNKLKNSRKGV